MKLLVLVKKRELNKQTVSKTIEHIPQRYSTNKKGEKVDHFFRAWVMANVQANNDQSIHVRKRAQKEYRQYADQFCLTAYETASDEERIKIEQEWRYFAREYILSCKNSKDYCSTLFGFVSMSENEVSEKILTECRRVTKDYPSSLGLEELYRPLSVIMMAEADRLLK